MAHITPVLPFVSRDYNMQGREGAFY